MKLKATLFIALFVRVLFVFSQDLMNKSEFDLGLIEKLNDEVLDINITNSTDKKVYLLRIDGIEDFDVKYTSKTFEVNQAQIIRFKYKPNKKGKFNKEIQLYFSSNEVPTSIQIKGDVQIVPRNLLQDCPDFNQIAAINPMLPRIPQEKSVIQSSFVNLMNNNSLTVSYVGLEVDDSETADFVSEVIVPKPLVSKTAKKDSLDAINDTEEPIIIPIATRADELARDIYASNNIVFLIDASMSMGKDEKLELLKKSMYELLNPLREIDKISVVTYDSDAHLILPPTSANNKEQIMSIIDTITASGYTSGNKGIAKAYEVAKSAFIENGNNQIFLATDGAFNIGEKNVRTPRLIKKGAEKGISISVIGIKNDKWTEKNLKAIAKNGSGIYLRLRDDSDLDIILSNVKKNSQIN